MRILAGGPARETSSSLFNAHLEGLECQKRNVDLVIQHEVVEDVGGHRWTGDKIDRVAECRQGFLDAATSYVWDMVEHEGKTYALPPHQKSDALFFVDTDIILGPGVLTKMLSVDAPVVYGVFWTYSDWGGSMDNWPQVWDINPYGWTQDCADALNKDGMNEVEVLGGGACTLIRGDGFRSRYFPRLTSLSHGPGMWCGEDRSYALGLECRGIKQIALTGLPIKHLHDVTQHTRPAIKKAKAEVGL